MSNRMHLKYPKLDWSYNSPFDKWCFDNRIEIHTECKSSKKIIGGYELPCWITTIYYKHEFISTLRTDFPPAEAYIWNEIKSLLREKKISELGI